MPLPVPPMKPVPPPQKRRSTRTIILTVLALLILLLGGFGVYYSAVQHNAILKQQVTMTAVAPITATARVQAIDVAPYNTAVAANGIMFGFDAQHTHFNPYERILSPANVSRLVLDWTAATARNYIDSSPAVANGVVYVGSDDGKLYAFHIPGISPY